jgi:hypothetical protein
MSACFCIMLSCVGRGLATELMNLLRSPTKFPKDSLYHINSEYENYIMNCKNVKMRQSGTAYIS